MNNDKPKTQEQIDDETYKATEYKKKVFSISKEDLAELQPLEDVIKLINTQIILGGIAKRAEDNYVAAKVLPKLGIKESADSKFNYDLATGRVIIYEPIFWCSICDKKKAEYKYAKDNKNYCKDCIEVLKAQEVKKIETKEEKKPVKKS